MTVAAGAALAGEAHVAGRAGTHAQRHGPRADGDAARSAVAAGVGACRAAVEPVLTATFRGGAVGPPPMPHTHHHLITVGKARLTRTAFAAKSAMDIVDLRELLDEYCRED